MKKRIIALILSAVMAVGLEIPVYGDLSLIQDGELSQEFVETEDLPDPVTDGFLEELPDSADVFQLEGFPEGSVADEAAENSIFTGDHWAEDPIPVVPGEIQYVPEMETVWYSYQPDETGCYLLKSDEKMNILEAFFYDDSQNRISTLADEKTSWGDPVIELEKGKTYYLSIQTGFEIRFELKKVTEASLEISRGEKYAILPGQGEYMLKFQPDIPEYYYIDSTVDGSVYESQGSVRCLRPGDASFFANDRSMVRVEDPSGSLYLLINTDEMEGEGVVSVNRAKTQDELLAEQDDLPQIAEAGVWEEQTEADPDLDGSIYARFVPSCTGKYAFFSGDRILSQVQCFDPDFLEIWGSGVTIYMEEGKNYYLIFSPREGEEFQPRTGITARHVQVESFTALGGFERTLLYRGVDIRVPDESCFPGIQAKVVYAGGYQEIVSVRQGSPYLTAMGDRILYRLKEADPENMPSSGRYTAEMVLVNAGLGAQEPMVLELGTVTVKGPAALPCVDGAGTVSAVRDAQGDGWFRFKTGAGRKYYLTCGFSGDGGTVLISRWKDSEFVPAAELAVGNKPGEPAVLQPNTLYYVRLTPGTTGESSSGKLQAGVFLSMEDCSAAMASEVVYSGKPKKPAVQVKYGKKVLKKGTDYTLKYTNNTEPGNSALVTITGKGAYSGVLKKNFRIRLASPRVLTAASAGYNAVKVTWSKVAGARSYTLYYKGGGRKKWTPLVSGVKKTSCVCRSAKLLTGTKYSFKVKAVRGKNSSALSESGKTAVPALSRGKIKKISAASNGLKLTWAKISGADGYLIQRRDNGRWITRSVKSGTLSFLDTGAKKGKNYQYRVCAYRMVNKKRIRGAYSAVKQGKR